MYSLFTHNHWSVVSGYPDGSDWILEAPSYQGLGGSSGDRLWQALPEGVVRIWDVGSRTILCNIDLNFTTPITLRPVTPRNKRTLYLFNSLPRDADKGTAPSGELVVIDLDALCITGQQSHLPTNDRHVGLAVMDDGALLVATRPAGPERCDQLVRIDGRDFSLSTSSVPSHRVPDSYVAIHWYDRSPNGKWWLRFDPTHFPLVEQAATPGAAPRRYFGLTMQLWSAFPLKFERRIVIAWLKAENLPDESRIYQPPQAMPPAPALAPAPGPAVAEPSPPSALRRIFGRKGLQSTAPSLAPAAPPDPLAAVSAAMLASVPARDEIYLAISGALHRPEGSPLAGIPDRAAFGTRALTDDAFWKAINENLQLLIRDTPGHVAAWQEDCGAVWIDRVGFLICVGMDGSVSPQLWSERLGLREGMTVPFANKPEKLVPGANRQAIGVMMPSEAINMYPSWPAQLGGAYRIDGQPAEVRFEPYMQPSADDGWREGVAAIPGDLLGAEAARKKIRKVKLDRSKIRIPLAGLDGDARAAAVRQLALLVDSRFLSRADDHEIDVTFVLGNRVIPEREFFEAITPADADWAVPALRELIERYVAASRPIREAYYQPSSDGGSVLAQAVLRLGEMDAASLPLVIAFGEQMDRGHEYFFATETVPAMIEMHGWTDQIIGLVAWTLLYNFYNSYDKVSTVWIDLGLRDALQRHSPGDAARWFVTEFSGLVAEGRLDWSALATLRKELGMDISGWEARFFAEMAQRVPETATAD